jgi:hypothetical protein
MKPVTLPFASYWKIFADTRIAFDQKHIPRFRIPFGGLAPGTSAH